ncbi:MAG: hypothetical protein IPL79_10415 [Myxococcales bacterium]|nr:hypothetical protein [Myxococcales bacterium]
MSDSTSIFSSRLGYVLAFGAVVLGLAVMGLQMWRLYGKIDAFPRFSVPGQTDVELAAGEYILYAEPLPGSILTNISAT